MTRGERILQMVSSLLYALVALATGAQTESSVLYFQSSQCEPCRQMEPALEQLRQQGWNIRKIDAPNQLEIARQYQVKNLPTLVLLDADREVDRIVGAATYEQIQSRLTRVAARSRSTPHLHASQTTGLAPQSNPLPGQPSGLTNVRPNNQPIVRGQSPGQSSGPTAEQLAGGSFPSNFGGSTLQGNDFPMLDNRPTQDRPPNSNNLNGFSSSNTRRDAVPATTAVHGGVSASSSPAAQPQPAVTLEAAMARASDATVRIKVEEPKSIAHGTGTIVAVHGSEGLVLTCGHLFRDMLPGSKLTVDMFAGTPRQVNVPAELIDFKAKEEDIALLAVKLPVRVEPVPILPKGESIQPGQRVFSFGCDHGNNPTRRDTTITRINRYMGPANIEIEGAPAVGRSGGGLFDIQGRLIGVCNAACNDENEGIYAFADVIYNQLARAGQTALFQPTSAGSFASSASNSLVSNSPSGSAQASLPSYAASQLGRSGSASTANATGQFGTANPVGLSNTAVGQGSSNWPDEDPRLAVAPSESNLFNSTNSDRGVSASAGSTQLVCIVKDPATGKDRILTINQPSQALLQAIEQQGQLAP